MDDIFNYQIQPFLTDQEFFKGLSICSKNNVLFDLRITKIKTLLHENLNKLIQDSFPFRKGYIQLVLEEIQEELYNRVNRYQDHAETDQLLLLLRLNERIIKKTSMSFGMHSYDFYEFERSKQQQFNRTYNKRCIDSFNCICDLVYFKYDETDFDSHHNVKVMKLNPIYRIPPQYINLLKRNFYQAYALIY